jgi:hypothetical protein
MHKIHLTKTQSLALPLQLHFTSRATLCLSSYTLPLQLHFKSQNVSFFSFPPKHLNESIIAHHACYETHLLYPPLFGYVNKTNNQFKMYNFIVHAVLCFSFSSLSSHRQHNGQCVCGACCCLTQLATYMSRFECRQFTTLQHVYCKSVLTAVTCAALVNGQSYSAHFILRICYRSPLSINTYI